MIASQTFHQNLFYSTGRGLKPQWDRHALGFMRITIHRFVLQQRAPHGLFMTGHVEGAPDAFDLPFGLSGQKSHSRSHAHMVDRLGGTPSPRGRADRARSARRALGRGGMLGVLASDRGKKNGSDAGGKGLFCEIRMGGPDGGDPLT